MLDGLSVLDKELEPKSRKGLNMVRKRLGPALLILVLLVAWEILGRLGVIASYLAPAPTAILEAIVSNIGRFSEHTWMTVKEVLCGYTLGFGVGFLLGVTISYSKLLKKALYPLIVVSQSIPHIALAPILVVWFGFGMEPKLLMVALITFYPVTISTADGLRSVDPELLRFIRSLGATEWQMFRKIKLPSALPHIFTGIKVSATYSVIGAVVGEWFGSKLGLGTLMLEAHRVLKTDIVFGTVLIMSAMGIIIFLVAVLLERLIVGWHYALTRRE